MPESEEEKDKTGEESDAEEQEQDDDLELEEEEDDGEDESEEDDKKPVTLKDLKEFRKGISSEINNRFAGRRHEQKRQNKPYKPAPRDGKEVDPNLSRLEALEQSNAKRDFGYEHQLSPKEVDLVFKFANGKPTAKTLSNPFVKGGLDQLRAQGNLRDNTPAGASSSSFEVDGKKFEELDSKGKQNNFAAKQKAILASKRR